MRERTRGHKQTHTIWQFDNFRVSSKHCCLLPRKLFLQKWMRLMRLIFAILHWRDALTEATSQILWHKRYLLLQIERIFRDHITRAIKSQTTLLIVWDFLPCAPVGCSCQCVGRKASYFTTKSQLHPNQFPLSLHVISSGPEHPVKGTAGALAWEIGATFFLNYQFLYGDWRKRGISSSTVLCMSTESKYIGLRGTSCCLL